MANDNEKILDRNDTTDDLANPQRDKHLPTMPDPVRDRETEQRLPTDRDPSKKPTPIVDPDDLEEERDAPGKVA